MKKPLDTLKTYFETGDMPTQTHYENLLDSLVHVSQFPIPIHTVEASSTYTGTLYSPLFPFRQIVDAKDGFSDYHWLSADGQTTNQRLCIYFKNPVSITRFVYVNAGYGTVSKGGIKSCRMYGMTERMLYSSAHGAMVPEMTSALFTGDLE